MVECGNRTEDGVCLVITEMLGSNHKPEERLCKNCSIDPVAPRSVNRFTVFRARARQLQEGRGLTAALRENYQQVSKREVAAKAPPRLGDWTEKQLKRIGVTEDRYKAAKELFGFAPSCDCTRRKKWLNDVSAWWSKINSSGE